MKTTFFAILLGLAAGLGALNAAETQEAPAKGPSCEQCCGTGADACKNCCGDKCSECKGCNKKAE